MAPDDRKYLTPEELRARLRDAVTLRTLTNWRASKPRRGPAFIKTGAGRGGRVLYPLDAVEAWEAELRKVDRRGKDR